VKARLGGPLNAEACRALSVLLAPVGVPDGSDGTEVRDVGP
jgi:hypothetical protein